MEDSNLMTVNKYVKGYNSNTREVIEPGFVDVQTTVDYDSGNFKYGSEYIGTDNYQDPLFFFQDPLLTTFDIILDTTNSPLFINGANSLNGFLEDYSEIYSIRARQKVHQEFKRIIYNLFNAEFKPIDRNKSYYINSITGLDKFTARIVDFEKDKITINLNEDVSMIAGYLAQLYNNLSYSYRDQRQMIPANLLRFNMYVKVHDVRNMPFYIPTTGETTITSFNKSYQIYLLRDCTFDFRKSKNFEDVITVGGFDAGAPTKPSTISIDVVYKSIEVESEFPLIMDNFSNPESSALKMNNKDKDILAYIDGLNTVFTNNAKLPEDFEAQVASDGEINNDGTSPLSINATKEDKDKAAKDNYKGGVVSSDIGTSKTREKDIKGFDRGWEPAVKNSDVTSDTSVTTNADVYMAHASDLDNTRGWQPEVQGGDVTTDTSVTTFADVQFAHASDLDGTRGWTPEIISSDINSDTSVTTFADVQFAHSSDLESVPYMFDPSVFDSDWNYGFGYAGPEMDSIRVSVMSQLNFSLAGFLFSLPFRIIGMFFGGYHGMQEMYIDTYAPNIPAMPDINVNKTPHTKDPLTGSIDTNVKPQVPLTGSIDTNVKPQVPLTGSIDTTFKPQVPLTGTIDTTFDTKEPLAGTINTSFDPKKPLSGSINTAYKPKPLLFGYIDTTATPHPPVSGTIDTSFTPHPPVSGVIDTSFKVQPPISGTIDTSFKPHQPVNGTIDTSFKPHPPVSGVIDTSFTPHPPVSGTIDTSFTPHPPVSGVIDTTSKIRGEIILGSLYKNNYKERNIDLGLLYLGVTHENILPITYLYAKSEKFNSLANYYVFNNAVSENKKLNNLSVDQTVRTLTPFELIYEYNNNIDVNKTLNNITLYNNEINKVNNMVALNVIGSVRTKPDFTEVKLYNNTNFEKTLALRYLYDKVEDNKVFSKEYLYEKVINDKKLDGQSISLEVDNLDPVVINLGNIVTTKPVERGSVELGLLYEPSKVKKILEPSILFEPKTKKTLDLGRISDNFVEKNFNNLTETESKKPFGMIAEYDDKPINLVNKLEESRKDFEQSKLEKQFAPDAKNLLGQYISENEIKDKKSLDGNTISSEEHKERMRLNNEQIENETKDKKSLDGDTISFEEHKKGTLETENKKLGSIAEYDGKSINVKESRKDFEQSKIEQIIIEDKPIVKQYISEDEIKDKKSLDGDTIFTTEEYKKEKPGLDNERLR